MASQLAKRIQWLMPVEREVYMTWKTGDWGKPCERCGSPVKYGEVGFTTRQRGSRFKGREGHAIHRRCVPTAEFEAKGVPARKLRRA